MWKTHIINPEKGKPQPAMGQAQGFAVMPALIALSRHQMRALYRVAQRRCGHGQPRAQPSIPLLAAKP